MAKAPKRSRSGKQGQTSSARPPSARSSRRKAKTKAETSRSVLPFELDAERLDEKLRTMRAEVLRWAKQGRYTKVRFKFRGKPLLPDLPLAAVAALEGLTFYWAGILRTLVLNVAGQSLVEVELIHASETRIEAGKEALLRGDLAEALVELREAESIDPGSARVQLNLGVALKLSGQREAARVALEKAIAKDGDGPSGKEARKVLESLR